MTRPRVVFILPTSELRDKMIALYGNREEHVFVSPFTHPCGRSFNKIVRTKDLLKSEAIVAWYEDDILSRTTRYYEVIYV